MSKSTWMRRAAVVMMLAVPSGTMFARAFGPPVNYPVGTTPMSVAVTDFNHDGKQDIVLTDKINEVSVLLGNGDGTFQAAVDYPVGQGTFLIGTAVGDFNEDGNPDVAVTVSLVGTDGGTIGLMLGKGDGTFHAPVYVNAGNSPLSVAAGDLNADHHLDFWVGGNGGSSVMLGNGDGTFQTPAVYTTGNIATAFGVAIADINNDHRPDLIAANYEGTVGTLLGNGDGTFQPVNLTTLKFSGSIAVVAADLNRDGNLDLAIASSTGHAVDFLQGNGDGTFQPETFTFGGPSPSAIVAVDLDGDRKVDLVVSDFGSSKTRNGGFCLLHGKGDGTFTFQTFKAAITATGMAVGKFNNDANPDLAISDFAGNTVAVALNTL